MDNTTILEMFEHAAEACDYLRMLVPRELHQPSVGIVCGSGLGGLVNTVLSKPRLEVHYGDIPHFAQSTVRGHVGKLLFGLLGNRRQPVVLMVGRLHFYEGHSFQHITFPIRVLKLMGIETLIVTNAAGGLNADYAVGDIVVLADHLNLAGLAGIHPLRGPNLDSFGVRFPALSDAYDLDLRRKAHQAWKKVNRRQAGTRLHEGVYAFVGGPSYETRAECRMLHRLGADLVGMSTVPEIIVARHSSIRVLALSLVTNSAVLQTGPCGNEDSIESVSQEELAKVIEEGRASHEEVLEAGRLAGAAIQVKDPKF